MFISGSLLFFVGFFFFFPFHHTGSMWEFLGKGLNLCCTAATRATVVRTQEPQPAMPSENPLKFLFLFVCSTFIDICLLRIVLKIGGLRFLISVF